MTDLVGTKITCPCCKKEARLAPVGPAKDPVYWEDYLCSACGNMVDVDDDGRVRGPLVHRWFSRNRFKRRP